MEQVETFDVLGLFMNNEDGSPLLFSMGPFGEERKLVQQLVEEGGGVLFDKVQDLRFRDNCIKLVTREVLTLKRDQDIFDYKYVEDCARRGQILPNLLDYRLNSNSQYEKYDPIDILLGRSKWSTIPKIDEGEKEDSVANIGRDIKQVQKFPILKVERDVKTEKIFPVAALGREMKISKKTRYSYSKQDQMDIINFIVKKKAYRNLKGNNLWKQMEESKVCGGYRTWQSMKEHFRKQVVNKLKKLGVSERRIRKMRACFNMEAWHSSDESTDEEELASEIHKRFRPSSPLAMMENSKQLIPDLSAKNIKQSPKNLIPHDSLNSRIPSPLVKTERILKSPMTDIPKRTVPDNFKKNPSPKPKIQSTSPPKMGNKTFVLYGDETAVDNSKKIYENPLASSAKTRYSYSKQDQIDIINFIIKKKAYRNLKGNNLWKQMQESKVCGGYRTWQSMKGHFRNQVVNKLRQLGVSERRIRKMKACFNMEAWHSSDESTDEEELANEIRFGPSSLVERSSSVGKQLIPNLSAKNIKESPKKLIHQDLLNSKIDSFNFGSSVDNKLIPSQLVKSEVTLKSPMKDITKQIVPGDLMKKSSPKPKIQSTNSPKMGNKTFSFYGDETVVDNSEKMNENPLASSAKSSEPRPKLWLGKAKSVDIIDKGRGAIKVVPLTVKERWNGKEEDDKSEKETDPDKGIAATEDKLVDQSMITPPQQTTLLTPPHRRKRRLSSQDQHSAYSNLNYSSDDMFEDTPPRGRKKLRLDISMPGNSLDFGIGLKQVKDNPADLTLEGDGQVTSTQRHTQDYTQISQDGQAFGTIQDGQAFGVFSLS